jgi:hypothetical protein
MGDDKTIEEISPEEKQQRLWLLEYLDLAGTKTPPKPKDGKAPKSLDAEDLLHGQKVDPETKIASNKKIAEQAEKIRTALDKLQLPSDASERQSKQLQDEIDSAKAMLRDERLSEAAEALKGCDTTFKTLRDAIFARRARTERFKQLDPINSFTRGQGQRMRAADAKYLKAEEDDRSEDAEEALREREALQKELLKEIERSRKVRSKVNTLTEDPPEALESEKLALKSLRESIETHLRNDELDQAEGLSNDLQKGLDECVQKIAADKTQSKELADDIEQSLTTFCKELANTGAPAIKATVLASVLKTHPMAQPLKTNEPLLKACRSAKHTRTQALQVLAAKDELENAVKAAKDDITGSVSAVRLSMSLINTAIKRAETTLGRLEPHNKLDYTPKLWSSWPSEQVPKPALDDLDDVPELKALSDSFYKLQEKMFKAAEQWDKTAGFGGTAINWDDINNEAEALASNAKLAQVGYYKVVSDNLYELFDQRKREADLKLKAQGKAIADALTNSQALEGKNGAKGKLSKEDQEMLQLIIGRAGVNSSDTGGYAKVKTAVADHFKLKAKALETGSLKVNEIRDSDGTAPEEKEPDPTEFGGLNYTLVGTLSSKDLYVRFDDSVTSSSNYHAKYNEALGNGVIASTSTGKAGIKNEPYGWVVKVTMHTAGAIAEIDNTMSPRASAGLQVSSGDNPAFYLNFDEWVARH